MLAAAATDGADGRLAQLDVVIALGDLHQPGPGTFALAIRKTGNHALANFEVLAAVINFEKRIHGRLARTLGNAANRTPAKCHGLGAG